MILELSPYSVTLFATTVILSVLAGYAWHRRSMTGAASFALIMAAASEWAFMAALEYGAPDAGTEIMFAKLTYLGALAIPPLWLKFVLDYCDLGRWLTRRREALLWALAAIAVALVLTNDYHGLIWSSIVPVQTELGNTLIYHKGIAFWMITAYIVVLMVPGIVLLLRKALQGRDNNKPLTVIVLLGSLIIGLSDIISEVFQYALSGVDIPPFAFAIVGLLVSWGIYRHHIFELLPVATEKLTESMADGVLILNKRGEIAKINVAARQMFCIGQAELGQRAEMTLARWPPLIRCLGDSNSPACEFTTEDDTGGQRWIEANVSRLQDEKNQPVGTLIILRDITERKQAEQTLRKSEYDLLKAEQLANIGYFELDLAKREAHLSEGCARVSGFPPGTRNASYRQFLEKIHPEDLPRMMEAVRSQVDRGKIQSIKYRILLPNGSVRHIHSETEMLPGIVPGDPPRIFGIVHDLTEHIMYEESLRKSERDRMKAEQLSHIGYYDWDLKKLEATISTGCVRIFGFPEGTERIAYERFMDMIHPDDAVRVRRDIHEEVWQGKGVSIEYRIVLPDGTVRYLRSESEPPVRDATGAYVRQFGIVQDITDLKLADEQLKASLREKEALLKEVHHRVKNNLQIITSLLNLQSVGIQDPGYLDMVRDSQNRIKSMALVHEQLYKSRDLSNLDISEYLNNLAGNISRSYSHASGNVALRTEIEKIDMDIDRAVPVGIIVTELISNAYKYAFPDSRAGEILVELRRETDKIVLTISDDGIGMPEGFEIGKTDTLGLQLVEMLTEQIEGRLEIESRGRTVFRISIKS